MKYLNASTVLPEELVEELSLYVGGQLIYVPSGEDKKSWGSKSGSRQYYKERNANIVSLYSEGMNIDKLSEHFNLSYDTIRKILKTTRVKGG